MSFLSHKPRPAKRAAAFWTPPAAVAALTLALVLLWPHRPRRPVPAPSMPEPGAAFVVADSAARSLYIGPDIVVGSPWLDFGPVRNALDDTTGEAPRRLPPPEYDGVRPFAPWTPPAAAAPSNPPPDLARRPVGPLLAETFPASTGGCAVALSPGLQRCGFVFAVPPAVVTGAAVVACFHVEVDDEGRVIHLLAEPSDNPAMARLIESAVNTGRAARAGLGDIQVSGGR